MYNISLKIPMLPASLNRNLRAHYLKRARENKNWSAVIGLKSFNKLPRSPLRHASITIIRHSHRNLDYDGLVGSMKPIVDALVTVGILSDDSWAVTGAWTVTQRFRKKAEGPLVEIFITENLKKNVDPVV